MGDEANSETKVGQCPRCKFFEIYEEQLLYRAECCGEYYCTKHLEPTLVMSFKTYQELSSSKDSYLRAIASEHWRREDGHPCTEYTRQFWEKYEEEKQRRLILRKEVKISYARQEVIDERIYRPPEKPSRIGWWILILIGIATAITILWYILK